MNPRLAEPALALHWQAPEGRQSPPCFMILSGHDSVFFNLVAAWPRCDFCFLLSDFSLLLL
jgi:hypothetical protein